MTKQEAQAAQHDLQHEKEVMRQLEEVYKEALKLVTDKIKLLDERSEQEDKPSIAYQKSFQTAVQRQLADILQKLRNSSYTTIEQYINECYTDGVVETMYQLHSDGIPLILPIDQEKVIRAVQLESKLSKSLYQSVGEDVQRLKRQITSIVSAGFAVGASLGDMENQIAARMIGDYRKMSGGALGCAKVIARTEGNRVANAARLDTAKEVSKHGADLVKQWDCTMDRRTRPHHVKLDRQVRELDEPFEVDGHKAMAPHQFDIPSEDINCRCRCDIRPRWAVEDSEDDMKWDNENGMLVRIDSDTYRAFKNRYLQEAEKYREKPLTSGADGGIIKKTSGAVSGALNPIDKKANEHAERYYASVRKMKTDVSRIAKNTGFSETLIRQIKNFVFLEEHDLGENGIRRFFADYKMAQTWQRLIDGKNIQPHDITLLKHEEMERNLMQQGYSQEEAHNITSETYDYAREAMVYYAEIEKHKEK